MAIAADQDVHPFDTHFQAFLVDLNGDGVPDAVAKGSKDKGVQVAQLPGGSAPTPGWLKAIGLGAAGYGAYKATQSETPAVPDQPTIASVQPSASQGVFVDQLLRPRPSDFPQPKQGGVLDMIGAPNPAPTPDKQQNLLMQGLDKAGQAFSLADYYLMGMPSSAAGLINSAIPGQPLGGVAEAQMSSANARSDLSQTSLGRDLLAMPEAFGGSGPGTVAGGMPGRGPRTSPYEGAYRAKEIEDGIRGKVMDAPPRLDYDPASTRQFRENEVANRAQDRMRQQVVDRDQRAAIDARETARAEREAPMRQRQGETQIIDDAISRRASDLGNARGDMLSLIDSVSRETGAEPWKVMRAMTDRGYDLSGLSRAAFQAPRDNGRLGKMTDESRALWDMVRYDNNVLYRQREAPYQPQEENLLMGGFRRPDQN